MRWTNMDEKEMVKAWAEEEYTENLQNMYLSQPDLEKESYWLEHNNSENIQEYDFSTVSELLAWLKLKLPEESMEDLLKPLAVAAFKQRTSMFESEMLSKKSEDTTDKITIPEFVYNF